MHTKMFTKMQHYNSESLERTLQQVCAYGLVQWDTVKPSHMFTRDFNIHHECYLMLIGKSAQKGLNSKDANMLEIHIHSIKRFAQNMPNLLTVAF